MRLLRPLPRRVTRPLSLLVLVAWTATMGVLVKRTYLEASSATLATDLARYGANAQWRGIYYKGEKIGFSVGQVGPTPTGFELQEDGRLQMTLFGAVSPVAHPHIRARRSRVRPAIVRVSARLRNGPHNRPRGARRKALDADGLDRRRHDQRSTELDELPVLSINLGRRLAGAGLVAGVRHQWALFESCDAAKRARRSRRRPTRGRVGRRRRCSGVPRRDGILRAFARAAGSPTPEKSSRRRVHSAS